MAILLNLVKSKSNQLQSRGVSPYIVTHLRALLPYWGRHLSIASVSMFCHIPKYPTPAMIPLGESAELCATFLPQSTKNIPLAKSRSSRHGRIASELGKQQQAPWRKEPECKRSCQTLQFRRGHTYDSVPPVLPEGMQSQFINNTHARTHTYTLRGVDPVLNVGGWGTDLYIHICMLNI